MWNIVFCVRSNRKYCFSEIVPLFWDHISFHHFSLMFHINIFFIFFSVSPPFSPAVLKPCFDLCVCHLQSFGQSCPFSAGQVFLSVEALLQLTDLHSGERRAGLLSLRWCAVLVRVTNTPSHSKRRQGCCVMDNERKSTEWDMR